MVGQKYYSTCTFACICAVVQWCEWCSGAQGVAPACGPGLANRQPHVFIDTYQQYWSNYCAVATATGTATACACACVAVVAAAFNTSSASSVKSASSHPHPLTSRGSGQHMSPSVCCMWLLVWDLEVQWRPKSPLLQNSWLHCVQPQWRCLPWAPHMCRRKSVPFFVMYGPL